MPAQEGERKENGNGKKTGKGKKENIILRTVMLKHKEGTCDDVDCTICSMFRRMYESGIERSTPGLIVHEDSTQHGTNSSSPAGNGESTSDNVETATVRESPAPYDQYIASCLALGYDPREVERKRMEKNRRPSR
ncbi:Hypothetical protein D9617_16g013860 [Elsinoe fawcettii]|nr:Hypothetical protein D9617_16g013860 [Elsinoe fawcettii]